MSNEDRAAALQNISTKELRELDETDVERLGASLEATSTLANQLYVEKVRAEKLLKAASDLLDARIRGLEPSARLWDALFFAVQGYER